MKPIQYYPKDPSSRSHQILRFLIKSSTSAPIPAHHLHVTHTPDSDENEDKMQYYQVTRSDGPTTDENMYASTDEDTVL